MSDESTKTETETEAQTSAEDTSSGDAAAEAPPAEDASAEDTSAMDTSAEDTSGEEAAGEEAAEDTSGEEAAGEDAAGEDTPTEDTPTEDTPTEDAPTEDAAGEDTPAEAQDSAAVGGADGSDEVKDTPDEAQSPAEAKEAPEDEAPAGSDEPSASDEERGGEVPYSPGAGILGKVVDFMGSFGLSAVVLLFLFLLTYLGTIEQTRSSLYEVQKRYFESLVLIHELQLGKSFRVPVPLPGVFLLLSILTVNLIVGGLIRIRKSRRTVGVIVVHLGMLLLILAGFVKLRFADDGHLTLYEGNQSADFVSYHEWEVAIWDASQQSDVKEYLIPNAEIVRLTGDRKTTFKHSELPFELVLSHYVQNAQVQPKGPIWEAASPVVDGYAILRLTPEKEHEANAAAIYCEVTEGAKITPGLLWGGFSTLQPPPPLVVEAGGKRWAVDLRRRRFAMPFTIRLDDFMHEYHPGTTTAKFFKSKVTKLEGGTSEEVLIQMNAPLRHKGYIIFQSSWGPPNAPPGARLFSGFSVVRNPSDQWPLYACIVISVGLILAFVEKLLGYVRSQAPKRKSE